jgi:hypothetical protein
MGRRRGGRRNRERQSRRTIFRAEWWHRGRAVVVFEIDRRGRRTVEVLVPRFRVHEVAREYAADWLKEYFGKLTHEERYALLWQTS